MQYNTPQPLSLVASSKMGTLERLPGITRRKVGMASNHHAPYDQGYRRATMAQTKRSEVVRQSESQKSRLSSVCSLQLDYMKLESLVMANQNVAVNTFAGLVHTAHHTMGLFENAADIVCWLKTPAELGGKERYRNMILFHNRFLPLLQ